MLKKSVPESITEAELVRTVKSVPVEVTTRKPASPLIPTSASAAHKESSTGDNVLEDNDLSEDNKFECLCSMCCVTKSKCHKCQFSLYCIDAIDEYFCILYEVYQSFHYDIQSCFGLQGI